MNRLRIFLTTSHISSVFMTLHARATHVEGDIDVLLVDKGVRHRSVCSAIGQTAKLHTWRLVHSFATEVGDDHRFEPSLRKRLTRKWKEMPVLRGIYGILLQRHERGMRWRALEELRGVLGPFAGTGRSVHLHLHTQNHLEGALIELFPDAGRVFFEHGLGDYHHVMEQGRLRGPLHALFATGFARHLAAKGITDADIRPIALPTDVPALLCGLLRDLGLPPVHVPPGRRIAWVLLEAVDMYQVPGAFWGAYIDGILNAISDSSGIHFLLKPHPSASAVSLAATLARCRERGISFTLMDDPLHKGVAAEVLFAEHAARTEHVFCLFSSACFYLSMLYPAMGITFHYSTERMERWTANAPPMYKRHFEALKPLIRAVFAERCVPY